jgi:uncharacterized protein (DUF58 family)
MKKLIRNLEKRVIKRSTHLEVPRVYILPTKYGLTLLGVILTLGVIGLTYGNNLILVLCFLLFSILLLAMHQAHFNLYGLKINSLNINDEFCGEPARIQIDSQNVSRFETHEVTANDLHILHVPPHSNRSISQSNVFDRRGHYKPTYIRLRSDFPYGLFRTWAYAKNTQQYYIYPKRLKELQLEKLMQFGTYQDNKQDSDFKSLEPYEKEPNSFRIDWKKFAKSDELYIRTFDDLSKQDFALVLNNNSGRRDLIAGNLD